MEINGKNNSSGKKRWYSIYIKPLDVDTAEEDLQLLCEKFGEIVDIFIQRYRQKFQENKWTYGFVRFSEQSSQDQAISKLNNTIMNGRRLIVAPSLPYSHQNQNPKWTGNSDNTLASKHSEVEDPSERVRLACKKSWEEFLTANPGNWLSFSQISEQLSRLPEMQLEPFLSESPPSPPPLH